MKIKLISDFHEPYDHWFDFDGKEFRRMSNEGPTRLESLYFFKAIGYKTPNFGYVNPFCTTYGPKVVYYADICHRGEDKLFIEGFTSYNIGHRYLYTEYINTNSISYRELQIGNLCYTLKYSSNDSWRSNCGDVKIALLSKRKQYPIYPRPLYAFDYLLYEGEKYYIDLNISPGIKDIDLGITNKEIVQLIKDWYENM